MKASRVGRRPPVDSLVAGLVDQAGGDQRVDALRDRRARQAGLLDERARVVARPSRMSVSTAPAPLGPAAALDADRHAAQ